MSAYTQTIAHDSTMPLPYPFLSQPPKHKQKKRPSPTAPLPTPPPIPAAATPSPKTKISMWAQRVQPGSPAPRSPFNSSPLAHAHALRTPSTAGSNARSASIRDFKVDLSTVGYASVFVSFASGPQSARSPHIPVPPVPQATESSKKAAGALAALRPRSKSTSHAQAPPKPTKPIIKAKKTLPAPAATDLALIQLLDGGAAPQAMLVQDADEALEYAPLISPQSSRSAASWVRFSVTSSARFGADADKRESVDSDLRSTYLVLPRELDPTCPPPVPRGLRNRNLLALPARGGGAAKHLCKPEYLAEIELAFPKTPTTPSHASVPRSPRARAHSVSRRRSTSRSRGGKKAVRRPAPLTLVPPSPGFQRPINSARGEFLSDSFAPLSSPRAPLPRTRGRAPAHTQPEEVKRKNSESSEATLVPSDSERELVMKAGDVWEREVRVVRKKPSMALKGVRRMFGRV